MIVIRAYFDELLTDIFRITGIQPDPVVPRVQRAIRPKPDAGWDSDADSDDEDEEEEGNGYDTDEDTEVSTVTIFVACSSEEIGGHVVRKRLRATDSK